MTRDEWLTSNDPPEMLRFLEAHAVYRCTVCAAHWQRLANGNWSLLSSACGQCCDNSSPMPVEDVSPPGRRVSGRKLRLFCVACFRAVLHGEERLFALADAWADRPSLESERDLRCAALASGGEAGFMICEMIRLDAGELARRIGEQLSSERLATQADLLREVVGDPFAPASPVMYRGPVWLASCGQRGAAFSVARTIYAERAFAELPILADALEDAGCADEDVLTHLRSPGPHVRGCWALDLILGKE